MEIYFGFLIGLVLGTIFAFATTYRVHKKSLKDVRKKEEQLLKELKTHVKKQREILNRKSKMIEESIQMLQDIQDIYPPPPKRHLRLLPPIEEQQSD